MAIGTLADFIVVSILATQGILMAAIPLSYIAASLLVVLLFVPLVDWFKVFVFRIMHVV
jgi:H+-transporting ATPase